MTPLCPPYTIANSYHVLYTLDIIYVGWQECYMKLHYHIPNSDLLNYNSFNITWKTKIIF